MDPIEPAALEARFAQGMAALVPGGTVVAAVSGGGDSVALLHLLAATGLNVVVAHLDHGLRSRSEQDAAWTGALAARLGRRFVGERVDARRVAREKKANLEATARELRYAFLARVAREHEARAILTAHTQNDQAETVLLQLAQGTGRALGMRPVRGRVLRPLLGFTHAELRGYLRAKGQDWLEDVSNADTTLDRNYLRHEVLPRLSDRFPRANQALARFAEISQLDDDSLEAFSGPRLCPDPRWPCPAYRVAPLAHAEPGLRRRALRVVLEGLDVRPETRTIEALERALLDEDQAFTLEGAWTVRRRDGSLFFIPSHQVAFPKWPGSRAAEPGDYLELAVGRKRLVEYLAERGVPPELKRIWPVKAQGAEVREVWNFVPEPPDQHFMRLAFNQAARAAELGEVPIGALLVKDGTILGRSRNQVEALRYATAHAELMAIQEAFQRTGDKVLPGTTLYVTLEPCPMCFGALLEARVGRVVYAAENLKAGALTRHGLKPPFAWEGGILERESGRLLRHFFSEKR